MTALPRLIVLTDRHQIPAGRTLLDVLEACVAGGLKAVIVRELDLDDAERSALITQITGVVPTVISAHHAHPDAAGIHVAATQPPATGRWGRSCHSRSDVERAASEGAVWATLSPFAPSASKPAYGPTVDPSEFADLPLPTFALGGIDPTNARAAVEAGAYGVAVMGSVMRARHPADSIKALLESVSA